MARRRSTRRSHRGPTRRAPRQYASGIISVNRRGYGFVTTSDGDFFIPAKYLGGAMDGDAVAVSVSHGNDDARRSGRVSHVVERAHSILVGTYTSFQGLGVVVPLDTRIPYDIFIPPVSSPSHPSDEAPVGILPPVAKDGDIVTVRILTYPSRKTSAVGMIIEVLGHEGDRGIEVEAIIRRYGLETCFSEGSYTQAREAVLDIDTALAEPLRRDMRDRLVFTIDPIDARDFDDAISVEWLASGNIRLCVHIADVGAYVPTDSSIDLDARRRATSVYLVDRVIPMLPEELSCGLCSLNPHEDRLAFTVELVLDARGEVVERAFFPSVVRSSLRLDYETVQSFYDAYDAAEELTSSPCASVARELLALRTISQQRFAARTHRGGIDFDGAETKVVLDDEGFVERIICKRRTQATGAIEEAMILANETVASFMEGIGNAMVYRVHEAPRAEALASLMPLLKELGYPTEGVLELQPQALQAVLDHARNRPEKDLLSMKLLRSMKRAVYAKDNVGHYGLASKAYTHFTSPIRRYPDLLVHRLLRAALEGRDGAGADQLGWLCKHSSEMERVAADAAWDSVQLKLCEYMSAFVGQRFDAIIEGVSNSGLAVVLPNTVRGRVDVRSLGEEYYVLDSARQTLTGEESGKVYRIGQRLQVILHAADVRSMTIDFELLRRP